MDLHRATATSSNYPLMSPRRDDAVPDLYASANVLTSLHDENYRTVGAANGSASASASAKSA
eukprot:CAMPEP_0194106916 /NCGR_PEP_ID=MMETSP0150-20130528/6890_1 /TAXON_ID=122233 /ORGANISM="Chaetoceros debilis, Strain MM31A-1" /LENGTH=61 /DNA_ID=CAMNT_0038795189 /DNA_START=50 /DNA_END=231 /DNA_ORIENTATION=-